MSYILTKMTDIIEFNPRETIARKQVCKKVPMEYLQPFTRQISGFEEAPYAGGTKFRNNDTIMARITPCLENGKTSFVKGFAENEVVFGSTEYIVMRAIPGASDPVFIYYLATSPSFREVAIKSMVGSSGRQRVQQDVLENLELVLPDYETQVRVGKVLSAFDDKIELNTQINHNLEEQAKAIFKSWFIDAPECKAWDSVPLKELVVAMRNGDWGKDNPCGNNTEVSYCIRGADIPDVNAGNKGKMPIRYILPKNYEKKHLVEGDIVVEISGGSPTQSTGRCAVISQALLDRYEQKIVCTNFCKALKPLDGYSHFLYYYWAYLYKKGSFFAYENGTTGIKNLDIAGIIENEFLQLPPIEIIEKFNELCDKIASTIFANGTETERLAQLRDALLPKLMSGEIDVSQVLV